MASELHSPDSLSKVLAIARNPCAVISLPEYAQQGDGYRQSQYRQHRCTSGTTGAMVGGVLGALLGREIGRSGRYGDPSTTGAIIGAGDGALAGRAIERNACR